MPGSAMPNPSRPAEEDNDLNFALAAISTKFEIELHHKQSKPTRTMLPWL